MKRFLLVLAVLITLGGAVVWSQLASPRPDLDFAREARNPLSAQPLNNDPASFQFAIVSDRTGGHRPQVFSRAVEHLNLLQPEFVVSVGDLIEGYSENSDRLTGEWREFQEYVHRLQMPFFYVPGNHDLSNALMERLWQGQFGRRYYDFVYKGVHFLMLNSEDPPKHDEGRISDEQVAFVRKAIERHKDARWRLVFLHKPMWVWEDGAKNGWQEIEKVLAGQHYTVFAGHVHRYQRFERQGQTYYQLATTGGSSRMRGTEYGEFDHLVWVTMKPTGPVLANILLDGIVREDLRPIPTFEEGAPQIDRKPTETVRGKILYKGKPLAGAFVSFTPLSWKPGYFHADAFTDAEGQFSVSTYRANDGLPLGEYAVSVVLRRPFYDEKGQPGKNLLPPAFATPETTALRIVVKPGANNIDLNLN